MKIYIITGQSGEYSDWSCWNIEAWMDREMAQRSLETMESQKREYGSFCQACYAAAEKWLQENPAPRKWIREHSYGWPNRPPNDYSENNITESWKEWSPRHAAMYKATITDPIKAAGEKFKWKGIDHSDLRLNIEELELQD